MNIDLTFTLSAGNAYKNQTSDYATLDECKQQIAMLMDDEARSLTFNEPHGGKTVIAARHIIAVHLDPAGDQ